MIKISFKGSFKKELDSLVAKEKTRVMGNLVNKLKDATPVDTGEARAGWKSEGSTIVNEVEHIRYLNEGSSEQAPAYFVEKTLLTQKGIRPSGTIVRFK